VIATANGVKAMKQFRADVRERAARFGRNPDDVKILYQLTPVLGDTEAAAHAANERGLSSQRHVDQRLCHISALTDIDFSQFDLDQPLPPLTTNGESTMLAKFAQYGSNKPLRQLVREGGKGSVDLIGTPEQVADRMGEIMAEVGGDGFLIRQPFLHINRRYICEVTYDRSMVALRSSADMVGNSFLAMSATSSRFCWVNCNPRMTPFTNLRPVSGSSLIEARRTLRVVKT
jgi:long-chain alkane monooxygenase